MLNILSNKVFASRVKNSLFTCTQIKRKLNDCRYVSNILVEIISTKRIRILAILERGRTNKSTRIIKNLVLFLTKDSRSREKQSLFRATSLQALRVRLPVRAKDPRRTPFWRRNKGGKERREKKENELQAVEFLSHFYLAGWPS